MVFKVGTDLNSVAILPSLEEKKREEVAINRDVVNTLVEITKFLGKHSLSFRGHRENWSEANKGNFKDLAELISKWSPSLAIHIEKIKNKGRKEVNFLSWERQNQLIDSVASCIKLVIIKQLKESRYFSVSIDTTFDISKKEQLAFIIRYVNFEKTIPVINERLLALKESSITSGINLFTIFQEICAENGLNWRRFLVGQSYDGAANMRGEYAGLQALVCAENPAATYTWCYAHRLSLIVVQGSSSSQNAVDLFGNLESLYAFITSSKKRVSWFDNAQKTHYPKQRVYRLKRVETTRWFSLSSALNTVIITLNALIDTLIKIQQDEGCVDFKSGAKATGLIEYFLSERFILTAFLYIDIFYMEFSPLPIHRPRKKKRLPSEQIEDNPITDPKYEFKIKTYFVALDTIITAINDRFTSKSLNLLKDISLFSTKRLNEIKCKNSALPKDAFNSFCDVYSKFVQLDELKKEYVQFANYFSEFSNIMKLPKSIHNDYSVEVCDEDNLSDIDLLKLCHMSGLKEVFPTLYTALHIATTLPVTSASPERTFSKLKIIKKIGYVAQSHKENLKT
ncbi:zinc finger MYM-type protein 1-like [Myzus persicae]|uniref:zinc finger MYM-type protein 1-like n=1 Tax=Myzus persicae TaxID=13164 RepID=UPI000B93473F|nr:zinc finger MYM-type protein 1-like [Myzus persicae]